MKLHADEFYTIGTTHLGSGKPCQDYALSGVEGNLAYAIVCDGCSTGARTDIGARVLALATAKTLLEEYRPRRALDMRRIAVAVAVRQDVNFRIAAGTLGMVDQDLLATCIFACVTPHGGFVQIVGDGVIVIETNDRTLFARHYEWEKGAPAYPLYRADGFEAFTRFHGGPDIPALTERLWTRVAGEEWRLLSEVRIAVAVGASGITLALPNPVDDSPDGLSRIALFSDGTSQIDGVDWKEAVERLMAFKNLEGEFVKRRMIAFTKEVRRTGKGPLDDLSGAAIRIERDDEEETGDGS